MSLVSSFQIGSLRCHSLDAGLQRLDGGAMFGVVPKPLWEKRIAPDTRNRIPLAMRPLLVEHPDGLVLIDNGLGNKEDAKFKEIYGIENDGTAPGPTRLEDALKELGYTPADIKWMIDTHLHFDHAGGNTTARRRDGDDRRAQHERAARVGPEGEASVEPTFANATYVVQKGELHYARHTNERTRASYLPHNFEPIDAAGKFKLIEGDVEILPGIRSLVTPGHVPYHQAILVQSGGETACFLADLCPTTHHLPLPWIMGYDVEPLRTLESRRSVWEKAAAEGWWIVLEHDSQTARGRIAKEEKGYVWTETVKA
ncbi:MAG TPA: MBL fold metallo-hydrolase [Gemmatimonadales bacterium]|nr:MBL fold metallo-hydrolase [Gemmatimonadales bacterium]